MNNKIVEVLKKVASEQGINWKSTKVNENSTLKDLGIDSITTMGIVVGMEENFGVQIPDEKLYKIKTVGDLVKCFEELTK